MNTHHVLLRQSVEEKDQGRSKKGGGTTKGKVHAGTMDVINRDHRFIFFVEKKEARAEGKRCHTETMMSRKAGNLQHRLHAVKPFCRFCRIQIEPTRF